MTVGVAAGVRKSAFKLLDAYTREDADVFFGREREIDELYTRVLNGRITLLYGASGTGKTSLIHCGLTNRFSSADWLPLFVRRGSDLLLSTLQAVRSAATTPIDESSGLDTSLASLYLDHFQPVYLIFDQFEEAFIFGTREERAAFGAALRQVLQSAGNTRFVFVIREEYFAGLTELEEHEPGFLENRMRVETMTRVRAAGVIEGSCRAAGVGLEAGLASRLLEKVFPEGKDVDLAHLQIFLDRLWRRAVRKDDQSVVFTQELLEQEGRVGDVLGEFLDEQTRQMGNPEKVMQLLKMFVSREGTKARATAAEIVSFTAGIGVPLEPVEVEEILRDLVRRRVLREKDEQGQYELSHDSLAAKVYERISGLEKGLLEVRDLLLGRYEEWRKRRVLLSVEDLDYIAPYESRLYLKAEVRELVATSKRALKEREQRRRRRATVIAGGLLAALAIVTAVVAWMAVEARRAERRAIEQQRRRLFVEAVDRIERDRADEAIAYLSEAVRLGDATAADRLASLLTQRTWSWRWLDVDRDDTFWSAEFSPDGAKVVAVAWAVTAEIRDATTGQPLTLLHHAGAITSAHFSPDGNQVITASHDRTARLWDAGTGNPLGEPMRHEDIVVSAQFSPDGTRIVTASWDNTARVWDAKTGSPVTGPLRHDWVLGSAQFSPDGTHVVTASSDKTARVWNARTGRPVTESMRHEKPVTSAQFSRDGTKVVTASWDQTARVWNARTGKPLIAPIRHDDWVTSAQFSPDGAWIVTASRDKTARIWDAQTGRVLTDALRHDDWVNSARFSQDGSRVVTASDDNTARVWDARTGKPISETLRHDSVVRSVQFSPDGARIVTASKDGVHIWQTWARRPVTAHSLGFDPVFIRFSPDGTRIVAAFLWGEARQFDNKGLILDAKTGKLLTEPLRDEVRFNSAEFSPDGARIVTTSWDKIARVWNSSTGKPLTRPLRHDDGVTSAHFSPDGTRIVTVSQDHTVRVWDVKLGRILAGPLRHQNTVNAAGFSPDGAVIVTASNDNTARIWDATAGKSVPQVFQHDSWVSSALFSPDGTRLLTAAADDTARIWDIRTGKQLGTLLRHEAWVISATFSPDGKRVVTASHDRTARVWDAATFQPVTEPLRHSAALSSADFSPDGTKVVTAAWDKTARVWDSRTGKPLTDPFLHGDGVRSAEFTPDGTRVATRGDFAQVWDVGLGLGTPPAWFLTLTEAIGGLQLSETGTLRTIPLKVRHETIRTCRERVNREPSSTDRYIRWARWFFADPETRTVAPFSPVTLRDQREREASWKAMAPP